MLKIGSFTCLLAVFFLAGCTVLGPDYQRPELDHPERFRHAEEVAAPAKAAAPASDRPALQQAVPADDLPKGRWWRLYNDPVLDDLQERAAVGNHELRGALARLEQARAAARISDADLLPRLDLQPAAQRSRTPEDFSPSGRAMTTTNLNLPLNLGYELDLWGRLRRQSEAAGADFAASAAELENFKLLLHGEVARTYFLLRTSERELALLNQTTDLRRQNLRLITNRYAGGLTSRLDVSRAETELAGTEAEAIALDQRRIELEHALALLLGETTAFTLAPERQIPTDSAPASLTQPRSASAPATDLPANAADLPPNQAQTTAVLATNQPRNPFSQAADLPPITPGLPAELLQRRPDVAAAERRLMAASARIGMAQAAFFPAIRLTGAAGYGSNELANLLNIGNHFWSLAGQLSQPIFDGGRNRARLAQAQAAYQESLAAYQQVILKAFKEVDDALVALKMLARQQEAQQRALQAARQSVQLSHYRYRGGLVSYLEVIESERSALSLERATLLTTGQQRQAHLALIRTLGGGWQSE